MTTHQESGRNPPMRHELHKAYQVIFGKDPRGAGIILEREHLARTFRERAYQFRPDRAQELGRTRKELSEALKSVALAFDLLADVVADQEKVWVMPWVTEQPAEGIRPWTPPRADPMTVKIDVGRSSKDVEEATQRIKDALGKLKAQTERVGRAQAPAVLRIEGETKDLTDLRVNKEERRSEKSLILGRHLHRRGLITLRQLIAAVAWQRSQRPAVGQIAKSWGILDDDQIQGALRTKEQGELFCDYAVRMGWMTPFQRLAVVGRQRVMQKPLGTYFVEQGILTEKQIDEEVRALQSLQAAQEKTR